MIADVRVVVSGGRQADRAPAVAALPQSISPVVGHGAVEAPLAHVDEVAPRVGPGAIDVGHVVGVLHSAVICAQS